jgi:hypothetical protein
MEHEEEEDHWAEQAITPPDLEEEGEHREQGTQLMPTEGDHQEELGEQGRHRSLVIGCDPWHSRRCMSTSSGSAAVATLATVVAPATVAAPR